MDKADRTAYCYLYPRFLVAGLPYPHYIMRSSTGRYSGYELLQLETLADLLNFTYRLVEPEDGEWGRRGEDGRWTGVDQCTNSSG